MEDTYTHRLGRSWLFAVLVEEYATQMQSGITGKQSPPAWMANCMDSFFSFSTAEGMTRYGDETRKIVRMISS